MRWPRNWRWRLPSATYTTLIGLLAATGMRVGEALRLEPDDATFTTRLRGEQPRPELISADAARREHTDSRDGDSSCFGGGLHRLRAST